MSSDVFGETGRITERVRPDRSVEPQVPKARAPGVSDWACPVLASTNEAIIRASDPCEMYAEVCEILVREGGYAAAWIEEVDGDAGRCEVATADRREAGQPREASVQVALRHDGRLVALLSLEQAPEDADRPEEAGEAVTDLPRRVAANLSFALGTLAAAERMRELADHRRALVHGVV